MSTVLAFSAPTHVVSGPGALQGLPAEVRRLGVRRIAVVADKGIAEAGLLTPVLHALTAWEAVLCPLVLPDPATEDVEKACAEACQAECEAVVAIGGGSALVVGKAVALRLRNADAILQYAGRDRAPNLPAPCIAIPTTAGSGSEVSNALVLHDPNEESIVVVRGRGYEPAVALLDGELLPGLPEQPMLYAALDALSHAVEALSVRQASDFTDALALHAFGLIEAVLPSALAERRQADLQTLLNASAIANLACGSAGLGLVHALSSAARVRLPHGYQNGVLLPHVTTFNQPAARAEAAGLAERVARLYERIGFEPTFRPGDVGSDEAASMIRVGLASPLAANNVRAATVSDAARILELAGIAAQVVDS